MMGGEAIINPEAEPGEARLSPRALLTFARPDYHLLGRLVQAPEPGGAPDTYHCGPMGAG